MLFVRRARPQEEFSAFKEGVSALSWNESAFDAPMMAVAGVSPHVTVFGFSATARRWQPLCTLLGHADVVNDVAWAPAVGRAFHLLATASRDARVRVWRVAAEEEPGRGVKAEPASDPLDGHGGREVWRVRWNVTGTVLVSSGDDGRALLWRQDMRGHWKAATAVEAQPTPAAE